MHIKNCFIKMKADGASAFFLFLNFQLWPCSSINLKNYLNIYVERVCFSINRHYGTADVYI